MMYLNSILDDKESYAAWTKRSSPDQNEIYQSECCILLLIFDACYTSKRGLEW